MTSFFEFFFGSGQLILHRGGNLAAYQISGRRGAAGKTLQHAILCLLYEGKGARAD